MTYKSKRIITSVGASVLLVILYSVHAFGKSAPAPDDLRSWAITWLIFIGISVVASIVIQIVFQIIVSIEIAVKEQACDDKDVEAKVERTLTSSMVEDEMDKLIALKSSRVGYICIGAGLVASIVVLALGAPPVVMLHVLFGSVFAGTVVEGCVSVYGYERGVHNG